jgi:hypothetical protein
VRNIEDIIKENELKLLDPKIRHNRDELEKLVSKKFLEYGSSGSIYTYNDIISDLSIETEEIKYKIIEMNVKKLSDKICLLLYVIEMNNNIFNRSSIWKREENEWKIIFHQGTEGKNNR